MEEIIKTNIGYQVDTEIYSGPLDLLLDLIQKAELDITAFSIAQVTDQYIAYIEQLKIVSAEDISEFLVLASKLIQIKSEALLPRPPIREEGEENLGEALARQLIIYRQVKRTVGWLNNRLERTLQSFINIPPSYPSNTKVDLAGLSVQDLVLAVSSLYLEKQNISNLGSVITIPKVTLRRKVDKIISTLVQFKKTSFIEMLEEDYSKLNIIVVFLAILELVKQNYAVTNQNGLFSNIEVFPTERIFQEVTFELSAEE